MTNIAERLDQSLRTAGVLITGVSIGDEADKATWRVAPASQQAAAQPIIDAFTMPTPTTLVEEDAQRFMSDKRMIALAQALWEAIPAPTTTKAQTLARAKAIYKTL